ncbi:MAG: GNAT family N-acetyltransferase [Thermoguttaceae bacterium]|nr:GNAT family N-acetyltransferase [Thermoguttaceae bacterium]
MPSNVQISRLAPANLVLFKRDMQVAFQKGAEAEFGPLDVEILPESHIDRSLATPGAVAFQAVLDGELIGGAVVVLDVEKRRGELHFLYVKDGVQSRGVGQALWRAVEEAFPETDVWETCTPYFEKRNIHFYVNRLGFAAVEFYNPRHQDPRFPNDEAEEDGDAPKLGGDYFFRFEKRTR